MSKHRRDVRQGRIVSAWIADKNGYEKLRPAVILNNNEDIQRDRLIVAAVTTTFPNPPPPNVVPLPWHPAGHPVTRLTRRSGVVCDWLVTIRPDEINTFSGDVPAKLLREIIIKAFPSGARD